MIDAGESHDSVRSFKLSTPRVGVTSPVTHVVIPSAPRVCRICWGSLENEDYGTDYVSPCRCKGSMVRLSTTRYPVLNRDLRVCVASACMRRNSCM
jgi:hypothetical protein